MTGLGRTEKRLDTNVQIKVTGCSNKTNEKDQYTNILKTKTRRFEAVNYNSMGKPLSAILACFRGKTKKLILLMLIVIII